MHGITISRCVGGGGIQGPSLGGWLKSFASKWFGGGKPFVVARPSTVPLTSSIAQSAQAPLLARWNFADRLNQYAERNRLIDVYTRQYRSYVMPSPRARLRGFGTLFSFVALAPSLRNVDSKDASDDDCTEGSTYSDSWISEFAKRNTGLYEKDVQPQYEADVSKLNELHILRRANAGDDVSTLRGALGVFIAKRNRAVEATCCIEEVEESDTESRFSVVEHDEEVSSVELVDAVANCDGPNAGVSRDVEPAALSDSDGFSVIEDESTSTCAQFVETRAQAEVQVCLNEKSVRSELNEVEESSPGCEYSVITDEPSQDQAPFLRFDVVREWHEVSQIANEPIPSSITLAGDACQFAEMQSIGETVFELDHVHASCTLDRELEMRSRVKVKVKMRSDSDTMETVNDRVEEWLTDARSSLTLSTESDTTASLASRDCALLRTLHDTADYLVYPFAGSDAVPRELLRTGSASSAPFCAASWRLVAPRISLLRVPFCSVLGDQLEAAHAGPLGTGVFDSRASRRTRFANATGIIRCLCTAAALNRRERPDGTGLLLVVRQRPRSLRAFLRELELEIEDSRALSSSRSQSNRCAAQSCAQAFDSIVLQLLEFGWAALVADRLRFTSFDFEKLLDALGVEVDAGGNPHVVLLDSDAFGQLFSAPARSRSRSMREPSANESFASFAFVVLQNCDRIVEALELAAAECGARDRLVRTMYAAREDNVADLRLAMDRLKVSYQL